MSIHHWAQQSFTQIAPFWPLQNLIAVNPLQGLENEDIEEALKIGSAYFEQPDLPHEMLKINIETIKWMGAFCDEGQATIKMPFKSDGLYDAWRRLAPYDPKIHRKKKENIAFLKHLPSAPDQAIAACFVKLCIEECEKPTFLTLLLTTLPGWASYIQYKAQRSETHITIQLEYLALRMIITALLWPEAKQLLRFHQKALSKGLSNDQLNKIQKMEETENAYAASLLKSITAQTMKEPRTPQAQFVFCIDVRSEPFRKHLESTGDYQTLGFAGFFGVPVQIIDPIKQTSYSSCPVLLQPKHKVLETPCRHQEGLRYKKNYDLAQWIKKIYQSLKYTFAAPFVLAEALGGLSGLWMGIRTVFPNLASKMTDFLNQGTDTFTIMQPSIEDISLKEKCFYAENALRMMGLTHHFAPIIVFCGHGSHTQNNAYATALDCGACGGRQGGSNAKILSAIMNCPEVREQLSKNGIQIPQSTLFLAAQHNTTTDEVVFFSQQDTKAIQTLKKNIEKAQYLNQTYRLKKLGAATHRAIQQRAHDWAQVRPEWGLARNAAFIVAPRDFTSSLNLDGRCFLHSYDHQNDPQGSFLATILTAPMIVAQWINMQYFFSTINPVAYGSGSKVTKNIIGKIGVMQGNASDLMHGLPLQSLYHHHETPYHEPQRLLVVVRASQTIIDSVIQNQPILKKLLGHGWVQMTRIEPNQPQAYKLRRDFSWEKIY